MRPVPLQQQLPKITVRLGQARLHGHGTPEMRFRFLQVATLAQGVAEVVASHGEIRLESQRLGEPGNRLVGLALTEKGQSQIIGDFGVMRPQSQSNPATGDRRIELAQHAVGLRQVGMIDRVVRVAGDGAADQQDCASVVALLVDDDTQQVQCLHVARLIRQNRLVECAASSRRPC